MMILKLLNQTRCYSRFSAKSAKLRDGVRPTVTALKQAEISKPSHEDMPEPNCSTKPSHRAGDQYFEKDGPIPKEQKLYNDQHLGFPIPMFSKLQELPSNLKKAMTMIKSRKNREKNNRVLLEGKRIIRDAVESGAVPETILFSRIEDMKSLALPNDGIDVYKLPYKTISLWSDMVTCPGIMAIFKTPQVHEKAVAVDALPLTIICDNIREPGNLGAILRVAAGVGCEKIILTKGCVDLWEPKVLRAGAGAHFRLPIHKSISPHNLEHFINVDSTIFLADNNIALESGGNAGPFSRLIPLIPYDAVDFTLASSSVVVIGGETEGLSDDVMRLASSRNGARIHIPLGNQVESLNTSIALGVILFEIKRQLLNESTGLESKTIVRSVSNRVPVANME